MVFSVEMVTASQTAPHPPFPPPDTMCPQKKDIVSQESVKGSTEILSSVLATEKIWPVALTNMPNNFETLTKMPNRAYQQLMASTIHQYAINFLVLNNMLIGF